MNGNNASVVKHNASVLAAMKELVSSKADVKFFQDKDKSIHIVISPLENVVGSLSSTGKTYVVAYGKVAVNGVKVSVTATRNVENGNELPEYGYSDGEDSATLR